MAKNTFNRVGHMFDIFSWTVYEEVVFLNVLHDARHHRIISENHLDSYTLEYITEQLVTKLGKQITREKVLKKFKSLSERFEKVDKVAKFKGVSMDLENIGKFVADEDT